MCQKESGGAIVAAKEAHSTQRGQQPRMHGPGYLVHYRSKLKKLPTNNTPLRN